jgi:hypothetical protein
MTRTEARRDTDERVEQNEATRSGLPGVAGTSLLLAWLLLLTAAFALSAAGPVFAQGKSDQAQQERKWNLRREERLNDYRDERGRVRPDLWEQGIEQFRQMNYAAGVARPGMAGAEAPAAGFGLQGVQWIQVGPQPAFPIEGISFQGNGAMSGEVLDLAIDPRNTFDRVIYSVTNDGGVWRSTDGGVTFEPKTDFMPSLSMGAIVLDPANPSIVYAGTGNLYDGNGSYHHAGSQGGRHLPFDRHGRELERPQSRRPVQRRGYRAHGNACCRCAAGRHPQWPLQVG